VGSFDLDSFLKRLAIPYTRKVSGRGFQQYHLAHCPFNPEHGPNDSAVSQGPDGKLGFKCFHDSCSGKDWHALRALVDGGKANGALGTGAGLAPPLPPPQRLPASLRAVKPLNPDDLPLSIRAAIIDIAERLSCPIDYVAIPVLVAAGVVLGNKVGILPKQHDESWVVHTGFWGGIVGSPGSMKTPALQQAFKPLQHLEEQAAIAYQEATVQYKQQKGAHDKAVADFKAGKTHVFPAEPVEPVKKRFAVNDITYQALGEILSKNPQGVVALADELSGLLQSLDTAGQEAARGFYLSGWGGTGNYTFDRITRGSISLNRYMLSVFGGFQPDRIKSYVRSAQNGSSKNDGLLQRFQLLVWPDLPATFQLIDRPPAKAALLSLHRAVIKLHSFGSGGNRVAVPDRHGIQLLHFVPTAQQRFDDWFVANEMLLRSGKFDPSEHGHFAKYRSLIPGLALLFHLLDGHAGPVCLQCFDAAFNFAKYLKSHALRIYGSVHGHDSAPTRALAEKLLAGALSDGFTQRSVEHKGWRGLSTKDQVQLAANSLVEYGWLTEHASENGGRKTTMYRIRPDISKDLL